MVIEFEPTPDEQAFLDRMVASGQCATAEDFIMAALEEKRERDLASAR